MNSIVERLQEFMEQEARSCSFDPEVIVVHGSRQLMVHDSRLMVHDSWQLRVNGSGLMVHDYD